MAELIEARAEELAGVAAGELLQSHPDLATRYHPLPRQKWAACLESRLCDLAAALGAESPELFAAQTEWSRVAFAARGTPVEDLHASMSALRSVLAREVTPDDAPLVDQYLRAALDTFKNGTSRPPERLSVATPHGRLGAMYLLKVLEGDRLAAAAVIHDAVRSGLPVRSAYLDVLLPVQQELGRLWHLDEISVAEEHFATSTTLMVMSQILPLAERAPRNGRSMLSACVEGNSHELGARMVADFFEMAGWRSLQLGPSLPTEDLVIAVTGFRVDLVALSVGLVSQLASLERAIGMLRHNLKERCPKIIVGGAGLVAAQVGPNGVARETWRTLGADGFAAGAEEAARIGDSLVGQR